MKGVAVAWYNELKKLTGDEQELQGASAATRRDKGAAGEGRGSKIGLWLWRAATVVVIAAAAILADRLVQAGLEKEALLEQLARAESVRDEFSRLPITKHVPDHKILQGPLQTKLRPEFKEIVRDEEDLIFDTCAIQHEDEKLRRQSWLEVWSDFFGKNIVNAKVDWGNPNENEPEWATRMRIYQDELCEYGHGLEHKIGCQDWWKIRCRHRANLQRCATECVRKSREVALALVEEDPWASIGEY